MLTRSLFQVNKYFASFKVLKQGFIVPQPPALPQTERVILLNLLKKEKLIKSKDTSSIKDPNFAVQQRQEAKILREQKVKEYQNLLSEYQKNFSYPKRFSSPFSQYFKKNFVKDPNSKVTEMIKKYNQSYQQLPQSEKDIYIQQYIQDKERYLKEKQEFEQRNNEWKIPEIQKLSGYQVYIQEVYAKNPKAKFGEASKGWKDISEEQKKVYHDKAEQIKAERKQKLLQFQQKHNIPDEVINSLYQRKTRSKSVEEPKN